MSSRNSGSRRFHLTTSDVALGWWVALCWRGLVETVGVGLRHSTRWGEITFAAVLLISGAACSGSGSSGSQALDSSIPLVSSSSQLRGQCAAAAERLGFAVPCPAQVPEGPGHEVVCPPSRDAAFPPCTGQAGELKYAIFFMDVNEFRVGPGYVGVEGKRVGHLTISAVKHEDSPGPPCFGTVVGTFRISDEVVTEYSCTDESLRVQRDARHGEGAYVGHLLLSWSTNGIDYAVSAHGHTHANMALVKRLAVSITFTAPARAT